MNEVTVLSPCGRRYHPYRQRTCQNKKPTLLRTCVTRLPSKDLLEKNPRQRGPVSQGYCQGYRQRICQGYCIIAMWPEIPSLPSKDLSEQKTHAFKDLCHKVTLKGLVRKKPTSKGTCVTRLLSRLSSEDLSRLLHR